MDHGPWTFSSQRRQVLAQRDGQGGSEQCDEGCRNASLLGDGTLKAVQRCEDRVNSLLHVPVLVFGDVAQVAGQEQVC